MPTYFTDFSQANQRWFTLYTQGGLFIEVASKARLDYQQGKVGDCLQTFTQSQSDWGNLGVCTIKVYNLLRASKWGLHYYLILSQNLGAHCCGAISGHTSSIQIGLQTCPYTRTLTCIHLNLLKNPFYQERVSVKVPSTEHVWNWRN